MIVDPDFLDHWRTAWLIEELGGDKLAPLYLLRLWGHCQVRRSTRFEIPAHGVKGICKAEQHSAIELEQALIKCEYLSRDGGTVEVLKWAEQNAALIAAWSNGGKGGRPTKGKPGNNPPDNPGVFDGMPKGNPDETDGEPEAGPGATQTKPIREEKSRDTSLRSVSAQKPKKSKREYTAEFEVAWAAYPARPGNSKADAFKAWNARLAEGKTVEAMQDGVAAYASYCEDTSKTGTEYVKQAATFFGPGLHFETTWEVKATPPKPSLREDAAVITRPSKAAEKTAEMLAREQAAPVTKPTAEQREALLRARQQASGKVFA